MLIYHYTTISGLIGIISSKELWASDCRFLNDGTELSYARDIFLKEVVKLKLPPPGRGSGYIIPGNSLDYFQMFISCFCEDGDLLSQWRGYGKDQGYSLGFYTHLLNAPGIEEIKPVQYGIDNPKEYFAGELDAAVQPTAHPGVEGWHRSGWILPRLVTVKHPSFFEEKEWRLLKQLPSMGNDENLCEINYRASYLGPIGYVKIPFQIDSLREIIIGPGEYPTIRETGVREMLSKEGFTETSVHISKIPFRR
jgi:hypothetical protein